MATVAGMHPPRPSLGEPPNGANAAGDHVAERIKDAARAEFELVGIRRSNMIDIARRAGVSRTTLYRRFPDRDRLVQAVMAREVLVGLARIDAAVSDLADPAESVVQVGVVGLRELRRHPILNRLRETEPGELFEIVAVEGGQILAVARQYLVQRLLVWQEAGQLPAGDLEPAAELMVRVVASLALTPDGVVDSDDDAKVAEFFRRYLLPVFLDGGCAAARG